MIKIERAEIKDAVRITEIKIKAFNKEINTYLGRNGGPPGYDSVESELGIIHNLIAYKVLRENEIIGAFFLIPKGEGKMCFEDFVIEPEFQGRGYGYTVLQLVEERYSEIKEWYLSTPVFSVGNQHLYEKFGYVETERNEEEVRYCKKIKKRCSWCCDNGIVQAYHDNEWGLPLHDDRKQFEFLMMEVMQCGLNWTMMLKKREIFFSCFDNFDYDRVAAYTEKDIQRIMNTEGMIHSVRKIEAVIHNAKMFQKVREEYGSFDKYLWSFSGNKTILYRWHDKGKIPAKNQLSDIISKDLRKRGFKYMGSITVYSHLQACGIINDHSKDCFMYQMILDKYPTVNRLSRDEA